MDRDDDEKDEEVVEHLRYENLLVYTPPSSGCLIDSRQYKSLNFSSNTYNLGDTMQIILNSGGDAIYGPACYLRLEFSAAVTGGGIPGDAPNFGHGTVMNFFRNMRLIHRSGNVLEEILNVNVTAQLERLYGTSSEDRRKLDGMLLAYQPMLTAGGVPSLAENYSPNGGPTNYLPVVVGGGPPRVPVAGTYKYVATIPLSLLSGVFGSREQLIPPALLAGAKLELDLDNGVLALANYTAYVAANPAGITNLRPTIVYDANVLFSRVNKQLLMEQAREPDSGLAFVYRTYFTTNNVYAADASLDVSQSASICERISAVVRASSALAGNADSFEFLAPFQTYQFRIGANYMPLQAIKLQSAAAYGTAQLAANDGREVYEQSLLAWGAGREQYHGGADCGASVPFMPDQWLPVVSGGAAPVLAVSAPINLSFTQGAACYATSLEKSPSGLAYSGQATNNSRILNIQLTGQPAAGGPFQVMGCLEYIRSARVSGDNCIVDR